MTEQGQLTDVDDTEDADSPDDEPTEKLEQIAEESDTDLADVRERYRNMAEYGVPQDEALRSVSRTLGATTADVQDRGDESATPVARLDRDSWETVEVRVVGAWEPAPDAVAQKAHLADGSGLIASVAFDASDVDSLEVDESYRIADLRVEKDEYTADRHGIKRLVAQLNSSTSVREIDGDVETPEGL